MPRPLPALCAALAAFLAATAGCSDGMVLVSNKDKGKGDAPPASSQKEKDSESLPAVAELQATNESNLQEALRTAQAENASLKLRLDEEKARADKNAALVKDMVATAKEAETERGRLQAELAKLKGRTKSANKSD